MGKSIIKMVVQMGASIYVSKLTNKLVGDLFDRAFGKKDNNKTKKGMFQ